MSVELKLEKGIEDDVAVLSQIEQRVFKHRGRLDGRVFGQPAAGVGAERGGAGGGPGPSAR